MKENINYFNQLTKNECYVIAEAGLNHNGSMEMAKKLIDLASIAGADAVKFQKRTINKLATADYLNKKDDRFPEFGNTYKEIREHLEFDQNEYEELKEYSKKKQIDFIVTAFDKEAVDFLEKVGVEIYKLASHSLTNIDLIKYISKLQKPTILSTGMSMIDELDLAVDIFKKNQCPLALMHCVSSYPTPDNECNLSLIDFINKKYNVVTGYSGHELGYLPSILAVARGAKIIERHFTLDKKLIGFDHKISLEPNELIEMVKNIKSINTIVGDTIKSVSKTEWITRKKYHVSMVSKKLIKFGEILTENLVEYKNPGTGIPYKDAHKIYGKKAVMDIPKDTLLSLDLFK